MYSQAVNVCWLLLLVITARVRGVTARVRGDDFTLIQWEADCDSYEVTDRVRSHGPQIQSQSSTTLTQCRSLCTTRRDCGGFIWSTSANWCHLYNINNNIIDQYLSQNWYISDSAWTWYSKTCAYDVGNTDLSCNIYTGRQYDNQYPDAKWRITYTLSWIPDLTATECQAWCGLYTGCRSVTYKRRLSDNYGVCHLYSTTIQHLLDSGLDGDVTEFTGTGYNYTTYDRYCSDGTPYIPGDTGDAGDTGRGIKSNGPSVTVIVITTASVILVTIAACLYALYRRYSRGRKAAETQAAASSSSCQRQPAARESTESGASAAAGEAAAPRPLPRPPSDYQEVEYDSEGYLNPVNGSKRQREELTEMGRSGYDQIDTLESSDKDGEYSYPDPVNVISLVNTNNDYIHMNPVSRNTYIEFQDNADNGAALDQNDGVA